MTGADYARDLLTVARSEVNELQARLNELAALAADADDGETNRAVYEARMGAFRVSTALSQLLERPDGPWA